MTRAEIEDQIQFYNQRWSVFSYANRLKLARCIAILEALSTTGLREPRILDLGSGAGWLSSILGLFGPTVGVDLSKEAVEKARELYPHVQFFQDNVMNMTCDIGLFDVVVSQEVIEHIEDQTGYLDVINKLLRPGGFLILTTPNLATFEAMPAERRRTWSNQPIEKLLNVKELRQLVAQRIRIVDVRTIIFGYGSKGVYRFLVSQQLRKLLGCFRLRRPYEQLALRLGFGLHTVLVGQKIS